MTSTLLDRSAIRVGRTFDEDVRYSTWGDSGYPEGVHLHIGDRATMASAIVLAGEVHGDALSTQPIRFVEGHIDVAGRDGASFHVEFPKVTGGHFFEGPGFEPTGYTLEQLGALVGAAELYHQTNPQTQIAQVV